MAIISVTSPKGGVGKTTTATILATVLAERGASVIVIDADQNGGVIDWARLPGVPATLKVVTAAPGADDDDDIIIRRIDQAAVEADFVIVDLEGRATALAGYAIAISDFVIIPVRGSNPDAKQAFRHMGLLKTQERLTGRAIPFAMLFTQTSPALRPKTQRFIEKRTRRRGRSGFRGATGRPRGVPRHAFVRRNRRRSGREGRQRTPGGRRQRQCTRRRVARSTQ